MVYYSNNLRRKEKFISARKVNPNRDDKRKGMEKLKTKTKFIKFISGFIIVTFVLFNVSIVKANYSAGALVSMTNSARAENGLGALSTNSRLEAAAYAKANDMLEKDYFAHNSPDGKTPWDFIRGAGYNYTYAGENLAIGYANASELFNAWMNSSTHRDNILNSNFREIGISVVSGDFQGVETIVVVQEFGAPMETEPVIVETTPENTGEAAGETSEEYTVETGEIAEAGEKEFSLIQDKSEFQPKSIYVNEEIVFTVTVSGEIESLEAILFNKKINLLESGTTSSTDSEKTYILSQKIEEEGSTQIRVVALDRFGNREDLDLGELSVNKKVITKEVPEEQISTMAAIIKNFKDNWVIYSLVFGGLIVIVSSWVIYARIKKGKLTVNFWRF